jgi:hypothetical protein
MAGRSPLPTRHNSLRPHLYRRSSYWPASSLSTGTGPLTPVYDCPYFFLLQIEERTDKVSTLGLKLARTPGDTDPAQPQRRGLPIAQAPPVRTQLPPQRPQGRPQQVTFKPRTTMAPSTATTASSGWPHRIIRRTCGGVPCSCRHVT